jgi:hypothetical protein
MEACLLGVEVSASGWSLAQRSATECFVSECNREFSIIMRPWPTMGCCAMKKKCGFAKRIYLFYDVVQPWVVLDKLINV